MATAQPPARSIDQRPPVFMSGSGYVNIFTPEETVLETFFVMLSKFNFDRAKDQCDREREVKSSTGGTNWCEFMSVLSRLASAEVNYFSLSYMERSWSDRFVRKEPLKTTYDGLIQELKKVHEIYFHRRGGTDFSWERKMTELVSNILEFIAAKRDMTDFYVQFDQTQEGCHLDYKRQERYLHQTQERYKDSFQHPFLKPVKSIFAREVGVLMDLLHAQHYISEWKFLPAILSIQSSHNKLSIWNGVVPIGSQGNREYSRQARTRLLSPPSQQAPIPYLYNWWCKLYVALLSKFSLYFHDVLSEHASVYDMKHLSGKLDMDYVIAFFSLIRQTPAICVCLVFDSNGLADFKGPKYHFPGTPPPLLTGMNSYPFMMAVPYDFDFHHHRPNIVSTIISKGDQLNRSLQPLSQHDEKLHCTYYMAQIDQRVTLVAISAARRSDRDTKTTTLLTDIATQLRNFHVAALLKPG